MHLVLYSAKTLGGYLSGVLPVFEPSYGSKATRFRRLQSANLFVIC